MMQSVSKDVPLVFPIHPRTRKNLETFGVSIRPDSNIRLTEPLGYLEFIGLVSHAKFVLTDSGGIQEETTVMGVPCLTMRNNTERPITCSIGTNLLVGTDPEKIKGAVASVIRDERLAKQVPPLWDGHAAERIVDRVLAA
jgi:UDP-N-acetylglucosamine 2-epimerase (non-hydrolysing)